MIVLWRLTTACNLACGFCAYDRRVAMPRVQVDPAEVERFCALLGAHRAATGEDVLVSWLGGEPMLWKGVLALSRGLRERHGLRVSVTTNGTTLQRPGVAQAMVSAFDEVTVSVDALAGTHERLRGWPGGWSRLADGVRRLAELRPERSPPRLRANVVLMRDTLPEFANLCDRLADWGVDEITFNQLGGRDRPEFHPGQALRGEDVDALRRDIPALVARMASRGVRVSASEPYLDRLSATARGHAIAVEDCEPLRPTVFIDEHGRIASCSFTLDDHGIPIADVKTVEDVASWRARLTQRRRATPAAVCRDCPSTQVFAKFGT
ncbi:radical SAM protein [Lysobacter changpingensis]|uniref:radical SAM protein n=1 Tax=Lysobacter changpingensis TaxID=2792784 RepID=UPI001A8E92DF|nr:radical SAM protein [Lysobacter changpingensis]